MAKHTQTIRQQRRANCLSVFDHFVRLAVKWLNDIFHVLLFKETNDKKLKKCLKRKWPYVQFW